ncbi:MAG TPA: flagellar filament capping protein FliD [Stellaceae bacterium]|nr:flagellar filament capping protein FliD [Stellaceae bacterium]
MTVSSVLSSSQITSLIQQAEQAFQQPATLIQNQEKPIQTQISALGQVQSSLSSLQSALAQLADVPSTPPRTVTATPNGVVSGTATDAAAPGTYSLTNIVLAHTENLISGRFTSQSSALGSGTISLKVGSGSAVVVNIPTGQDTLAGVAAAINTANAGVSAAVVFDGTGYELTLTGNKTGSANNFTVAGTGGLTALSYSGSGSAMTETQAATNSSFTLNGIGVSSGSNTITGTVPGVTLTLQASGSATVTVGTDTSGLATAAQAVVTALNSAVTTIGQYDTYDPTKGAGPLLGDVGIETLRQNLMNAISGSGGVGLPVNTPYNSLSSIGFSVTASGTVTLDNSTFSNAVATNYAAVAALLGSVGTATSSDVSIAGIGVAQPGSYAVNITSNSGGTVVGTVNGQAASGTNGVLVVTGTGAADGLSLNVTAGVTGALGTVNVSSGLYSQLTGILNGALDTSNGSVTQEVANLNSTLTSMNQQITSLQQQAQQQTLLLTQQFSAAEQTLQQLSTVGSFLSQYFSGSSSAS